jgi:hypothetical protein
LLLSLRIVIVSSPWLPTLIEGSFLARDDSSAGLLHGIEATPSAVRFFLTLWSSHDIGVGIELERTPGEAESTPVGRLTAEVAGQSVSSTDVVDGFDPPRLVLVGGSGTRGIHSFGWEWELTGEVPEWFSLRITCPELEIDLHWDVPVRPFDLQSEAP